MKLTILLCLTWSTFAADLYLTLRGQNISRDATINIADIGEVANALICITDDEDCCNVNPKRGQWQFPNASLVRTPGTDDSIYRNRSNQQVLLHRRNDAMGPLGEYCCEVATDSNPNATICIMINDTTESIVAVTEAATTTTTETTSKTTTVAPLTVMLSGSGSQTAGESYTFTCTPSGGDTSSHQWTRNGEVITAAASLFFNSTQTSQTLTLSPLKQGDTGQYLCKVQNISSGIVSLNVGAPSINITVTGDGIPTEGSAYTLTCTVSGHENLITTPIYEWSSNLNPLQGEINESSYTLNLVNRESNGTYTCNVIISSALLNNSIMVQDDIILEVTVPLPGEPNGINIIQETSRSITLSWTHPSSGGYVDNYIVQFNITVRGCSNVYNRTETTTLSNNTIMFNITDVEEDSIVMGTVAAENIRGIVYTPFTWNTTSNGPGVVQNLRRARATNSSITIQWDELSCVERNGIITGYRIEYGTEDFTNSTTVMGESSTSFTATNLHSLTIYMFRVAALNDILSGNYSRVISIQTTITTTDFTVSIRNDTNPIKCKNYTLTCMATIPQSLMGDSITYQWLLNSSELQDETSSILTFNPVDRHDDGNYSCQVNISSPLLNITITDSLAVNVTVLPPEQPVLEKVSQESDSLNISWTQPSSGGCADSYILQYTATVRECSDTQKKTSTISLGDSITMFTITGLEEDSVVEVILAAINIRENATTQFTTNTTTSRPDMVQNLMNTSSTFSSITVTWDELSCVERNGVITSYMIEYGNTTYNDTDFVIGEPNTTFTATGLHPLTTYMFRVAAVSEDSIGIYSNYEYYETKAVPKVTVTVASNDTNPTEGRGYLLFCNASVPQSLMASSTTYHWLRNSTNFRNHTSISFNPVDRRDNGTYTCRVIITTPLLSSEVVTEKSIMIQVTVPIPQKPVVEAQNENATTITISWTQPSGDIVDSYIVMYTIHVRGCDDSFTNSTSLNSTTIMLSITDIEENSVIVGTLEAINIRGKISATFNETTAPTRASSGPSQVTVNPGVTSISIQWNEVKCTERNGDIIGYTVRYGVSSSSLRKAIAVSDADNRTISIHGLLIRTNYSFEVAANNSNGTGIYSSSIYGVTTVPNDLGFYLKGELYHNNSIIDIRTIGIGENALYCITNNSNCCQAKDGRTEMGEWDLPGETESLTQGQNADFNKTTHASAVLLNRLSNTTSQTGLYICRIPDSNNRPHSLFAAMYNANGGVLSITGNKVFQLGETANITCSTPVPVQSIQWVDESSTVMRDQDLTLTIASINFSHNSTQHTCRIMEDNYTESESIIINVKFPELSATIFMSEMPLEGQNYTLTCDAVGDEVPANSTQFMWRKVGINETVSQSRSLTLSPLRRDDTGEYNCTIIITSPFLERNLSLSRIASVTLDLQKPGPISHISVTESNSKSIIFTWMISKSIFIGHFEIAHNHTVNTCPDTQSNTSKFTIDDGSVREYTLRNLSEDSTYIITLTAINNQGNSTATIMARTNTSAATCGPSNVMISPRMTSISIMWDEVNCEERNGEITGYTVRYGLASSSALSNTATRDATSKMFTIESLMIRTAYSFEVAANNQNGVGASTSVMGTTTIPEGVGFYLNGTLHSNNSLVDIESVGMGTNALHCFTNRTDCCDNKGGWYLPGQTDPVTGDRRTDFRTERSASVVSLIRLSGITSPAGLYRCEIPVSESRSQSVFIALYNASGGIVSITGNKIFQLGETTSITCSTPVPVQSIQWVDESDATIMGMNVSDLNINITSSSNNTAYTCRVRNGDTVIESKTIILRVIAMPTVEIMGSGQAIEGKPYTLVCGISPNSILENFPVEYQWFNGSNRIDVPSENMYRFNPTDRYDNGTYSCNVIISSPLLNSRIVRHDSITINITVYPPAKPDAISSRGTSSITISWTQPSSGGNVDSYTVQYNATVKGCSSTAHNTMSSISSANRSFRIPNLEEDSVVMFTLTAINIVGRNATSHNTTTLTARPDQVQNLNYFNTTFNSITVTWDELSCEGRNGELSGYRIEYGTTGISHSEMISGADNITYTASALDSNTTYMFKVAGININHTGTFSSITEIATNALPPEVLFRYKNNLLYNHSTISQEEIINGNDLFCFTNFTECCRNIHTAERGPEGFWYFPNGTRVPNTDSSLSVDRGRSFSAITYSGSHPLPTGLYRCTILDLNGQNVTLFAGIYPNQQGIPSITSPLKYDSASKTLNCTSSGGPATTVTWTRNSVPISQSTATQQQQLTDTSSATYHNLLTITSDNITDYNGTVTCTVSNSRGTSITKSVSIKAYRITGSSLFQLGETTNIACSTPVPVQSIQWVDESNTVVRNGTSVKELRLDILITSASNLTTYTCTISDGFFVESQTATIEIGDKNFPRVPDVVNATSTQTTITISWSLTTILDSRNETFTVMYGTTPGVLNMTSSLVLSMPSVQQYSVQLISLQPGTRYYYQIHSENRFTEATGNTEPGIKTEDAKSTEVRNVNSQILDNNTLALDWQPPELTNGDILHYLIQVTTHADSNNILQERNVTNTNFTASHLSKQSPNNI